MKIINEEMGTPPTRIHRGTPYPDSYISGYIAGFWLGVHVDENPYVPSEGEVDHNYWLDGYYDGRFDWRWGYPAQFSMENEGSLQ